MGHPTNDSGKKNPLKAIISGGIVGGIEISITYPTEFVKTQMQLYPEDAKLGMNHMLKTTFKKYGITGFYKGLSALILFSMPKTAVRFASNEYLKNNIFTQKNNRIHTFMAGLGAGVTEAIFVVTPSETLKVKLIHDKLSAAPKFKGLAHGIKTIIAQQGWGGLYKGLVPTIIKQGSNQGVRFLVYDETLKMLKNYLSFLPPVAFKLLAGGIAGAASVYANTPVDTIKTKMQGLKAAEYKNSMDCFLKVFKNEGIKGLYKGTVPRLGRVVLDVAITFTLYDYITEAIVKVWPDKP